MKEKTKVNKSERDTGFNWLLVSCLILTIINFYYG